MGHTHSHSRMHYALFGILAVIVSIALITLGGNNLTGQVPPGNNPNSSGGSCENGDGINICRCYCRVTLSQCNNGSENSASLPLCREEWDGEDCSAIGYYDTQADAQQCGAHNGQPCWGYIRPGNGNPEELGNVKVQGELLGCEVTTL